MKERVIDVSRWDENVDFNGWKNKHDLWGVIVKAGGNETRLGRYKDPKYEEHYRNAKNAGLHVGAYYYTVVTSIDEARKDAQHLIELLKGHDFDLPIYMDVEDPRQFTLSKRQLTDVIKTFCDTLRDSGYYAGLYIQGSAWLNNVVTDELRDYANWIAWWRSRWPSEAGDIGLWQQGTMNYNTGDVQYDDVSGYTDLDWCIVDYPSRIKTGWTIQIEEGEPAIEEPIEEKKEEKTMAEDNRLTKFCNLMRTACEDWSLGYDQYNRWDIRDGGECDCSSLVIWAARTAGFDTGDASYTGNMSEEFTARGWSRLYPNLGNARPGDILLNDTYHTCAVISGYGWNATIAQASIDERGRATGGESGDQSGYETNTKGIYEYGHGWDCILRYEGESSNGATVDTSEDLDIDGYGGPATIRKWQAALGTSVDGVISGQFQSSWQYFPRIVSVSWERSGSALVRAVQQKLGIDADGYWGPATSRAIQSFLNDNGYNLDVDGYFGPASVQALQDSLNKGLWN